MKRIICLVCVLCGLTTIQARQRQNFDADWLFVLADSVQMAEVNYNDASWRRLDVPHDWAIEGDFYAGNPSGAGGGALPGGIGWYRKHFNLGDCETNMKETKFFLEFDGVYMNRCDNSLPLSREKCSTHCSCPKRSRLIPRDFTL